MDIQRKRHAGVIVVATGCVTILLLCLLLAAYAMSQIGAPTAIAVALLVSLPICWLGLRIAGGRPTMRQPLIDGSGG